MITNATCDFRVRQNPTMLAENVVAFPTAPGAAVPAPNDYPALEFPSELPPPRSRTPQRQRSASEPADEPPLPKLGMRKMRRYVNDALLLGSGGSGDPDDETEEFPYGLGTGTRFSDPAVLMELDGADYADVAGRRRQPAPCRVRPAPAPSPEGATRVAGRAAAMFQRVGAEERAALEAYAGNALLKKAQEQIREYIKACVVEHGQYSVGTAEAPRRRAARRRGRVPAKAAAARPSACPRTAPAPSPLMLPAVESVGLRRAFRGACQFYCLRSQSVVGRSKTAPRATQAQLLPPGTEERWRGLMAASEVSLVELLAGGAILVERPSTSSSVPAPAEAPAEEAVGVRAELAAPMAPPAIGAVEPPVTPPRTAPRAEAGEANPTTPPMEQAPSPGSPGSLDEWVLVTPEASR